MAQQLAKRLTNKWAVQVFQQFNQHKLTEKEACELLDIKRAQLYLLRKQWLQKTSKGLQFELHASGENKKHCLDPDIEEFLHQELTYITEVAHHYRRYTLPRLISKIRDSSEFEIVHKTYFNTFLFIPIARLKL